MRANILLAFNIIQFLASKGKNMHWCCKLLTNKLLFAKIELANYRDDITMKRLKYNNTYDSGKITFLILQDSKLGRFIGICLEFDLETEGKTKEEAQELIQELAKLWLDNVRENKLSEELLNKDTLEDYWNIIRDIEDKRKLHQNTVKLYSSSVNIPVLSTTQLYSPSLPFTS